MARHGGFYGVSLGLEENPEKIDCSIVLTGNELEECGKNPSAFPFILGAKLKQLEITVRNVKEDIAERLRVAEAGAKV